MPPIPKNIRFSEAEEKVLTECGREAFYRRCVPLSTLLGVGTYYAIKSGRWKPNAKWGAIPKVTLAVILGYFVGNISYQGKCAEKLMNLPGSELGDLLRKQRNE